MNDFLKEFFKRFALKSPKFFQHLQTVGIILMAIGGIPEMLQELNITLPGKINDWVNKGISIAVTLGGIVTWILAKLPVANAETLPTSVKKEALPFSKKHEL